MQYAQPRFGILKPFALAGTGDFKGRNVNTGKKAIVDLKATYEIYTNKVTWQTNVYSFKTGIVSGLIITDTSPS